jgi:ribosomal protein S12 methylthiotransferase accessory factor
VSVYCIGDTSSSPLIEALNKAGVRVGESGHIRVVVTDDYLQGELKEINRKALSTGQPWLLAKLQGTRLWIGPYFRPGISACWECIASRISANRQLEAFIAGVRDGDSTISIPRAELTAAVDLAANLTAIEIVKIVLQGVNPRLESNLFTFDTVSMQLDSHAVSRRPQCTCCREQDYSVKPTPVVLRSRKKERVRTGESFSMSLEDTFESYSHHISPITGILTWLVESGRGSTGLWYTYSAGHSFPLIQHTVKWLIRNVRSSTGGKGPTPIQAKVSAMCEGFERYSAVYQGNESSVMATYTSISLEAVHPSQYINFSAAQLAVRDNWNSQARGTRLHVVPNRFDEAEEVSWTPMWSLVDSKFKFILSAFCYIGHPETRSQFFYSADANGCAAGTTPEEAILRGFLELIERDAVAIWWYNRIRRPRVDLTSFGLPYIESLVAYYRELGRELWALDVTNDMGIPTFAAISRRVDRKPEDIILGCAAHLNPATALLRALAELNQFLPAVMAKKPDGATNYDFPDDEASEWWKTADCENQRYLWPDDELPAKTARDYRNCETDDFMDDVRYCVDLCRSAGLDVLVLDQTRPDVGMPVYRVLVPGLRHFWRRLGPGRLYEVPVRLGWIREPLTEGEMNPMSIFF